MELTRLDQGLEGLHALARMPDQIWPLPADHVHPAPSRGLGAPQDNVWHGHRLGSRLCLALESERACQLTMLDAGPEGIDYCLCPSWFAADTRLGAGRHYLPQPTPRYPSFMITGKPGRERLLAILAVEPLGLDWMPRDASVPARTLSSADIEELLQKLRLLDAGHWSALATYFDVI